MMIEEIIYGILLVTGIVFIGGAIYGFVMVQIDKYRNKKGLKEQKEYYKRYTEYRRKQMKARGKAKINK